MPDLNDILGDDQITPLLPDDEQLTAGMLGLPPATDLSAGRAVIADPNATGYQPPAASTAAMAPSPMLGSTADLESRSTAMIGRPLPQAPPMVAAAMPGVPQPPTHDMDAHNKLVAGYKALQTPTDRSDPRAAVGWKNYLLAALLGAAKGWGKDIPGAVQTGADIGNKNYNNLEEDRKGKLEAAKTEMDQHEFDEGVKQKDYSNQMTGYNAQMSARREQNAEAGEKRREQEDSNTPVGKPFEEKDAITGTGTGKWKQKTKGGSTVDAEEPAKKTYATPYAASQSDDPAVAKQGRKDYEHEVSRKDAHENEYEAGKGPKAAAPDKTAIRTYNQKTEKLKTAVDNASNTASTVKDWQSKPMLRNQVKSAIDEYNNHVDAADDIDGLKSKPAKIPYPWDKGSGATAPAAKNNSAAPGAQPNTAGGGKKSHQIGDKVTYGGHNYKIKSITGGKAELVPDTGN